MRLKHLLGVVVPLLLCSLMMAATEPQLASIKVTQHGSASVVILHATGNFSHNEYRPEEGVLLVDLAGVSAASLRDKQQAVDVPGLKNIRVLTYKGGSGAEVTRVEFSLADSAGVNVTETRDGLEVRFTPKSASKSAASANAVPKQVANMSQDAPKMVAAAKIVPAAATTTSAVKPSSKEQAKPASVQPNAPSADAVIQHIAVASAKDGVAIEITGATKARPLQLAGPDRLVLDFDNTLSAVRTKNILVNSPEIKSVRVGTFQASPLITRVVIDLKSPRDFKFATSGNKLTVLLVPPANAAASSVEKPSVTAPAASNMAAKAAPAPEKATSASNAPTAAPVQQKASEPVLSASAKPEATPMPKPVTPEKASVKTGVFDAPEATPKATKAHAVNTSTPTIAELKTAVAKVVEPANSQPKAAPAELKQAEPKLEAKLNAAPPVSTKTDETPKAEEKQVAPPAATPAAAPADKSSAQEFAFVEPKYSPKASEPTDRAKAAATTMARSNRDVSLPGPEAIVKVGPAQNLALSQQQDALAAATKPAAKPKYTGEPISVNLKDVDLKDFFRLIHEISGLNVVLDPGVRGVVTIVLDDVPWDQALDIVLQNNQLDRQLEGNVLRIASVDTLRREAEARRAQIEAQALAVDKQTVTRYLSYAHSKDVAPLVKKFLSPRGDITSDDRTNSLIISDIPSTIPEIDRLLAQLDRKTQEVEIEARVVAATRSFARDIGMQLGFGWGNGTTAVGGPAGVDSIVSPVQWGGLIPHYLTTGTGQIPLFSNHGVGSPSSGLSFTNATANYRIDAILTMAESRGLLKILSRPRIVTQTNVAATVRQGVHVPIVTQAQLGGPPTVSYVDAFLRLTVTPQITVENTIFLAVDVENTTPDWSRTVQGNPALNTQQATTQVLVTDGGTVVIGGVIQTQNSVTTSETPLLGEIPVLGNLFKRRSVSTETRELIFFITPRIIQT